MGDEPSAAAPQHKETEFLEIVSGRRRGSVAAAVRALLALAEPVYGAVAWTRNGLYDARMLPTRSAGCPVVCLGNLTTGGVGKTPLVATAVAKLQSLGCRPGVASRGYGAAAGALNDEARVLEQLCPSAPQVQSRDRVAAARALHAEHRCDVVVLDDGFQHRRLLRNLDIVIIDALQPWGYGRLLPRGLLREPLRGLRRAGLVIVTRADLVAEAERTALQATIAQWTPAPRAAVRFVPRGLVNSRGERTSLSAIAGARTAAFCGIGNPEGFRETLRRMPGADVPEERFLTFPDHHAYTAEDVARLSTFGRTHHVEAWLTTLKDLVKLQATALGFAPLWAVEISPEFLSGEEHWTQALEQLAAGRKPEAGTHGAEENATPGAQAAGS